MLQKNIVKARKIIVELYVKCETDYVNGLKIYEAIVEKKILETTQSQINTLKKESDVIVSETKNTAKTPNLPIPEKPVIPTSTTLPNTSSLVSESINKNDSSEQTEKNDSSEQNIEKPIANEQIEKPVANEQNIEKNVANEQNIEKNVNDVKM